MKVDAPKEIPSHLYKEYTLDSSIKVAYYYVNEVYSDDNPGIYTKEKINEYLKEISNKNMFYYGETDKWLYEALDKYSINGMEIAVMGSANPLYESICIHYKGYPAAVDYRKIISHDERLKTLNIESFKKRKTLFDAAFSISSFEHDGLGRYGDPLNPNADIEIMKYMKTKIKKKGLLFMAVPVGEDILIWNANRIYGKKRLPMLLEGWKILDSFGFR